MDKRIVRTLENIREAFFQLAYEGGIDSISVKSLCERAEINKATFYAHYQGMYQLIEQMEDETIAEIVEINQLRQVSPGDVEGFMGNMLDSFLRYRKDKVFLHSPRRSKFIGKLYECIKADFSKSFPKIASHPDFETAFCFLYHGLIGMTLQYGEGNRQKMPPISSLSQSVTRLLSEYE